MGIRSTEEIESSTEKLVKDLAAVIHDTEELLQAGAQDLTERGFTSRERLTAALEAAKETRHKIEAQARAAAKAADRLLREHPYQSIGIAFGVGLLLGVLIRRR
jgi:ElaB/YqjD/DUF883 family membrane-anchored ribosome-binding protein